MNSKKAKLDKIMVSLIAAVVLVIVLLLVFNSHPIKFRSSSGNQASSGSPINTSNVVSPSNNIVSANKHVPVKLNSTDVLVSFRIDDITFETKQKQVLENALFLARKYNITFDLAVIAKPFDELADPAVFKIYQDNQDVFEVVAHGWDHEPYLNKTDGREFAKVPYSYQEEHIKKMKEVFERHKISTGKQVFVPPWNAGNNDTISIAKQEGYLLVIQEFVPNTSYESSDGIIKVSRVYDDIDLKLWQNFTNAGQKRIILIAHPKNLMNTALTSTEKAVDTLFDKPDANKIKYDFLSRNIN